MADFIFRGGDILDPKMGGIRRNCEILVRDGLITEVAEGRLSSPGASVVDLGGRTLMPGLIDCHVHVTAARVDLGGSSHMPPSLVAAHALKSLQESLHRGFTTLRDAGGADRGLKEAVDRRLYPGPRLFISGRALSQTGGHGDFRERIVGAGPCLCEHALPSMAVVADGVGAVRKAAREEIRLGADQIKVMAGGGVASPADPISQLQYSMAELEAICDEAARSHMYVMAHVYTPDGIQRAVEAGVRTIEHGNLLDEQSARMMADAGAYLVPTLATYQALNEHGKEYGFPTSSMAKLDEVINQGTRSLSIAKRAGVPMAYGTDLLGELQRFQGNEFSLRAEVLSTAEIITSATTVAADVLNMRGRLGTIETGAHADLLIVDGNPLEDISLLQGQGEHLAAIMKGGEFIKYRLED